MHICICICICISICMCICISICMCIQSPNANTNPKNHNLAKPYQTLIFVRTLLTPRIIFLANTVWSGPMSTSVPSGVFIHPAVWPQ